MKKIVIAILLTAAALACWLYLHTRGGEGVEVRVIPVVRGEIASTLTATGRVVSRDDAEISPPAAAQVKTVCVEEGARVARGALLATLDDRAAVAEAKAAAQSLREAEEKVRRMERNHQALVRIHAAGGVSSQAVEEAGSDLEMARAVAGQAAARLSGNRVAVDKMKVRAPFAGTVTAKKISPGEWAAPGLAMFSLAREERREIEVMVDESDGGLVTAGQPVDLTSDAFPGYHWTERVLEVAPAVKKDGSANSIKVRVSYGAKSPGLKLGQQVDARILTARRANALRLPFEAVIRSGGKASVALVRGGKVELAQVTTGIEDAQSVEMLKGVAEGEEVVLPEGKPVKAGVRVKSVKREQPRR